MREVFILSAARTPIGKFLGDMAELTAPQLGAIALKAAIERDQLPTRIPKFEIDEVIFGNVVQAGVGQNPARQVAILAGLPPTTSAFTVNKVCGSGLKAVMLAAQAIRAGDAEIVAAGGMESMSRAPHLLMGTRVGWKYGDQKAVDGLIHDGLWCAFEKWPMGDAAEHIAQKCGVSRGEQDRFSAQSHRRAAEAWARGDFNAEVVPVTVGTGAKARTVSKDEGIRAETTTESLAKLRPAFKADGTVTAGNASQLSDGAAALILGTQSHVANSGIEPLGKIVAYATSGVHPREIFIAPVPAVRMVLEKAGLGINQIDLFELNEAFSSQMLACNGDLKIPEEKLNVNGGGVALGHPIGASGARVLTTLLYALKARKLKRGLACLCLGGGNAVAMIVERT